MSRRRPRWLPTLDLEGKEPLAALLLIGIAIGLSTCWGSDRHASETPRPGEVPPRLAPALPPSPSLAASASASPAPGAQEQVTEFCDLVHGAAAELSPTSVSLKPETRTNPFTGTPVTYQPRNLTPQQRDAARRVIERAPRAQIREGCYVLELGDGARLVMVGLDTWCEKGCRFHARQLDVHAAKLVLDLATAASMTIDVGDRVFIPAGVASKHARESYATTVRTPDELAKLVMAQFVGGVTQYRGPVRGDGARTP